MTASSQPAGRKGVGEIGGLGVVAAISNAIWHTEKRRGANSPSSNTQRTRGSAPKNADFDRTSRPQRAAASKGVGTRSGAAGKK
ncbi:hypothetical protein JJB11_25810 [Ramlibacter ginsenosidimutans]|uniref:Uncharacterized protein n=1 Tax=Ramlibacter ginsenosidimutans TaxID=502333 RepID=A0A934WQR9_9BURK|nr:hypothetical protein [Ramlibacter ginsenosidimutans]MBK6009530.1 hypothetical protein [Ramlibacter ginsenosidimutans]